MEINTKIEFIVDRFIQSLGFLGLGAYVLSTMDINIIPSKLLLPFAFLLGCIGIIAIVNIHCKYSFKAKNKRYYYAGFIFLIIAFFQLTLMVVVQQSIIYFYGKISSNLLNAESYFTLINSIQLGMDVVFDIFYCVGIILYSLSFISVNGNSIVGWYGVLVSIPLLTMNLITFPIPPKSAGFFDIGILSILWWILLIKEMKIQSKK